MVASGLNRVAWIRFDTGMQVWSSEHISIEEKLICKGTKHLRAQTA